MYILEDHKNPKSSCEYRYLCMRLFSSPRGVVEIDVSEMCPGAVVKVSYVGQGRRPLRREPPSGFDILSAVFTVSVSLSQVR